MSKPRKPNGLGAAGTKLWERTVTTYDIDESPEKLAILEHAARTMDDLARYEREAANEPLTVKGSANQMVIHPLRSEIRFARGQLATLLARLNFAEVGEDG